MSRVFASSEDETSRTRLLEPMVWSWSETLFERPDPPRSELLELRKRIVHGGETVLQTTRLLTSMISHRTGEGTALPAEPPGPGPGCDFAAYDVGSFITCTQIHPDDDHYDLNLVVLREEGERWDVDEWGSFFKKAVATLKEFTDSASSITSLRELLRRQARDERIRDLPEGRRSLYESIRLLREEIGSGEFDIDQAIRELRGGA